MQKVSILFMALLLGSIILFTHCQQTELTSAKVYMNQSNYDKVIELCNTAIEKVPENPEAYYVMGQAYGHKKMYIEMNDAFTKSLEYSQKNAADIQQHRLKYWIDIFNNGIALIKQDNLTGAIEKFEIATKLSPERIDAFKNLAYAYGQNDQDSMAIITYLDALKQDPNDLEVKGFLGMLYYQTKQYDIAIESLQEVLSVADPQSKEYNDALYHLAYSYDLLGRSDKAIEAYQTALQAAPDDKDLMFNMGRLYFMRADYKSAIEGFQKVLTVDPDDFDANFNIGISYIGIADSLYDEARKIDDQGNPVFKQNEIDEKEQMAKENFEKSIPYLEKSTQIEPDNPNPWLYLGKAYVRNGMPEKGQEAFDKAEELK